MPRTLALGLGRYVLLKIAAGHNRYEQPLSQSTANPDSQMGGMLGPPPPKHNVECDCPFEQRPPWTINDPALRAIISTLCCGGAGVMCKVDRQVTIIMSSTMSIKRLSDNISRKSSTNFLFLATFFHNFFPAVIKFLASLRGA